MDVNKTIDALNSLIQINLERIEGYDTAFKETDDFELKSLFTEFGQTSVRNKKELEAEVIKLNGIPTSETSTSGQFYRLWMEIKTALTSKKRSAILDSCKKGEEYAKEAYTKVLTQEVIYLTNAHQDMIRAQFDLINNDQEKLDLLREG
jgi:uncharacterized protein (TIGR02284 family)